jgi:replication-associated recombination protein RarA
MIPKTKNGLPTLLCISAMQKCIRRGMEREAMEFAAEVLHTSKAFHSMVCNRLEVICHEDLDTLAAPHVVPFVAAALAQSKERYSSKMGEARLMVGNAIRLMCRAPKSRAGCHFAAAIGLRALLEEFTPAIPDWAHDKHTPEGRARGRGLAHFREEGAKLKPPPVAEDPYTEEAYRLWALQERQPKAKTKTKRELFDEEAEL